MGRILKLDKLILQAKESFKVSQLPNQVYQHDLVSQDGKKRFARIIIEKASDCYFAIHLETTTGIPGSSIIEVKKCKCRFLWEAKDTAEQWVTLLELELWQHIDEREKQLVWNSDGYAPYKIPGTVMSVTKFQTAFSSTIKNCWFKPLVNGYRAILIIEPDGKFFVRLADGKSERFEIDAIGSLLPLVQSWEDNGFAAEGVYSKGKFYLTDILYLKNEDVSGLSIENKEKLLNKQLEVIGNPSILRLKLRQGTVGALHSLFCVAKGLIVYMPDGVRYYLSRVEPTRISLSCKKSSGYDIFGSNLEFLGSTQGVMPTELSYCQFDNLNIEPNGELCCV